MRSLIQCLVCLALLTSVGAADELEALDKAKTAFQGTLTKQQEQLKTALEKAMKDASKAGKLEEVEELHQDLQSFVQSGISPKSTRVKAAGQKYSQTVNAALGKLSAAYERAIKAETKNARIREAQALRAELEELEAQLGIGQEDAYPIQVISAIWKYDDPNQAGNATDDVKAKLEQLLKNTNKMEVGLHTLGGLTGIAATKSVDSTMKIGGATLALRLGEGSEIRWGELTGGEAKATGVRMGRSALELLSASWGDRDGEVAPVDLSQAYLQALQNGPVTVAGNMFPSIGKGSNQLTLKFRVNKNLLTIVQSHRSVLQIAPGK